MANNTNIAPVISPDILKTISTSTAIKTFGDQLKNKSNEVIIGNVRNKAGELGEEIENITKKEIQAGINYNNNLERLNLLFNQKQITQEQYTSASISENISYNEQITQFTLQKKQLETNIQIIQNNPYNKIKDEQILFKNNIKNIRKNIEDVDTKSKKDLIKQIKLNLTKSLPPIIGLQLVNSFTTIISQRKKLEDLVDQVNLYIDIQVKDQNTVTIATNLRNNAISLINNSIKKLQSLEKILKTISSILILLTLIIIVIERILSLPIPFLLPIKVQFQPTLQKILKIVASLSALLTIATLLISNEIQRLIELRERLKQISLQLDLKSFNNLNEQELTQLSDEFLPVGVGEFESYKGFKFQIKEEQNPQFVVKGNKRRYAVAIDRYGVEAIRSEYSFTQDPNDLIEQLKLVIDQQNLQG